MIVPRVVLIGNADTASRWVGVAKKIARDAYSARIVTKIEKISEDVTLHVTNIFPTTGKFGGVCKVFIEAGGGTVPYLSGIHEITLYVASLFDTEKWAGQFYPARSTARGIESDWYQYSNTDNWTGWEQTDFLEQSKRGIFTATWVWDSKPVKNALQKPVNLYYPSMYTGTMRLVVQKWYGYKLLANGPPPFGTDCGIFIPNGSELVIDRNRWVIQVTRSGVWVWPIRFIDERIGLSSDDKKAFPDWSQEEQNRYDYGMRELPSIPPSTVDSFTQYDRLEARDRKNYKVQLLSEADFDAIHLDEFGDEKVTASNWYSTWAFNYAGDKASAVLIGIKTYNTTQKLYHSTRYELRIGQDSQGRPTSAELVEIEADYLLTWSASSAPGPLAEHPLSMYQKGLTSLAVFTWWGRPEEDYAAPQPVRDAPVYAFYNRSDEPVVLRHTYSPYGSVAPEVRDTFHHSTYTIIKPAGETYPAEYGWSSDNYGNGSCEMRDAINRGYDCYYVDGIVNKEPNERSRVYSVIRYPVAPDPEQWLYGGFGAYGDGTSDTEAIKVQVNNVYQLHDPYHFVDFTNYHHVGTPSYEREGLFFYQDIITVSDSRTITEANGKWLAYLGTAGRAKWNYLGVPGWTIVSTYGMGSYDDYAVNYQGAAVPVLPLSGTIFNSYTVPGGTQHNETYQYIGSIADTPLDLPVPADAATWFNDLEQIYEAVNGAFSGKCVAAAWPDQTCWAHTLVDYPITETESWTSFPVQFPDFMFVGDETTSVKSTTNLIDLEAIRMPSGDE